MDDNLAIVLVHGTWSSPQIWDYLECRIRSTFHGVPVERIKWSGAHRVSTS
jgi:hypothetical protein